VARSRRKEGSFVSQAHRRNGICTRNFADELVCALFAEVDAEGFHFAVEVGGHPSGGGFLGLVVG